MKFVYLCATEVDDIKITWSVPRSRSPGLIEALKIAGISLDKLEEFSAGKLNEDFRISPTEFAKVGAMVLMVHNGDIVLELSASTGDLPDID